MKSNKTNVNIEQRPLIFLVAGARPNFMKIAPIIRELKKHRDTFEYRIVHTGQHYDQEMSEVFFEELEIPQPDYHLEVGSGTHSEQTAKIMIRFEKVCIKERPDLVLVVGDVNSTLACSIVAKKLHIKVAHVEAGLRSGDMTMPEEINRIVTDSITDYLFVTEKSGVDNLIAEGKKKDNIYFVGHVMIDNLFYQVEKLRHIDNHPLLSFNIKRKYSHYGVVTLHRPSNVDNKETLSGIIDAFSEISEEIPLVFPIHPRTKMSLDKFRITLPDKVMETRPLPYLDFLNLFKDAELVLTDSGGIQEETTALGVPCITLRDNTERPITISEGTNVLAGTLRENIIAEAKNKLDGDNPAGKKTELWDGMASERILVELKKLLLHAAQ